jgi:flagellar basal body rod protein FlgB
MHLSASGGTGLSDGGVFYDESAGAGQDGNYVSLDREAAKLAANQSRYDVVATMLAAQYGQLAYAANDGAGS